MKRLLMVFAVLSVVAVVVVVAGAVIDQRIRVEAEDEAGRRLQQKLPIEGTPVVSIDSFPFVLRVLLDGTVEELEVSMRSLESNGVTVDEARLRVHGHHCRLSRPTASRGHSAGRPVHGVDLPGRRHPAD